MTRIAPQGAPASAARRSAGQGAGFTRDAFRFLHDLARHNNRAWFQLNRARFDDHLRQPYLRLIADLAVPLAKISRHYLADPRPVGGSLFRIHRDTRFAKHKKPYKEWAGAKFFHAATRAAPRSDAGFGRLELIDDLRRKDFVASVLFADAEVLRPDFPRFIIRHFRTVAPLLDYLCGALDLEF